MFFIIFAKAFYSGDYENGLFSFKTVPGGHHQRLQQGCVCLVVAGGGVQESGKTTGTEVLCHCKAGGTGHLSYGKGGLLEGQRHEAEQEEVILLFVREGGGDVGEKAVLWEIIGLHHGVCCA